MLHHLTLYDLVERDVHDLYRLSRGGHSHKRSQMRAAKSGACRYPFTLHHLLLDRGRYVRERLKEQGKDLPGLPVAWMVIEQGQILLVDGLYQVSAAGLDVEGVA